MTLAEWISSLRPWQAFGTFTFRWEASLSSATRSFERFMRREGAGVSYFYAIEPNPARDGYHIHALLHSHLEFSRKKLWSAWWQRYGRNRIEPPLHVANVELYCAKYCFKSRGSDFWWDVRLVGSRVTFFAPPLANPYPP